MTIDHISLTYCESPFFKRMTRLQKGVLYLEINQKYAQLLTKQSNFSYRGISSHRTLIEKIASPNTSLLLVALRTVVEPNVEVPMHELSGVSDEIVVSFLHKLSPDTKRSVLATLCGNKNPCVCEFADATRTYYKTHEGRLLVPFDEYLEITGYRPEITDFVFPPVQGIDPMELIEHPEKISRDKQAQLYGY